MFLTILQTCVQDFCLSFFQIPEWLHKSLHGRNVETFSPKLVSFLSIISLVLVAIYVICLLFNKLDREKPLKGKLADLDRQLFKARNEALILKREMETVKKSGTILVAETAAAASAPTDVHLYKELEALKAERDQVKIVFSFFYHMYCNYSLYSPK